MSRPRPLYVWCLHKVAQGHARGRAGVRLAMQPAPLRRCRVGNQAPSQRPFSSFPRPGTTGLMGHGRMREQRHGACTAPGTQPGMRSPQQVARGLQPTGRRGHGRDCDGSPTGVGGPAGPPFRHLDTPALMSLVCTCYTHVWSLPAVCEPTGDEGHCPARSSAWVWGAVGVVHLPRGSQQWDPLPTGEAGTPAHTSHRPSVHGGHARARPRASPSPRA